VRLDLQAETDLLEDRVGLIASRFLGLLGSLVLEKLKRAEGFLQAGDKVKAMILFRGREQSRPEQGVRLLRKFAEVFAWRAASLLAARCAFCSVLTSDLFLCGAITITE
jgi:hypothetical protein